MKIKHIKILAATLLALITIVGAAVVTISETSPETADTEIDLLRKVVHNADRVADVIGTTGHGGVNADHLWVTVTAAVNDEWTAAGHGLSANDPVVFKSTGVLPAISGNTWSDTLIDSGRVYYARDVTATTFKVADYIGAAAINLTGTGSGTHSVDCSDRTNLVLGTSAGGAITAQAADSAVTGGDTRGPYALDLQRGRTAAAMVAAAPYSTILNGYDNKIVSTGGFSLYGMGSTILGGWGNTISATGYGSVIGGYSNSINAGPNTAIILGNSNTLYSAGSGQTIVALGSIHLGGAQDAFYGGGFHNLVNGFGTTDFGAAGAQIGAVGSGTFLTGAGGSNQQVFGAGVCGYWNGCEFRSNHANKDKAMIRGNLILDTSTATSMGTIANAATRTNEFFMMGYYPASIVEQATGVNTGTEGLTGVVGIANNTAVRVSSTDDLPAPLVVDTTYYVVNLSGATYQLSLTSGGAAIDLTTTGTGIMSVMSTWLGSANAARWCRLFPNKLYTFNFTVNASLKSATTPTYAVWQRRATYLQSSTIPSEPTLVGSVQTVGTDVGSNAGSPPANWALNLTTGTDGLHVSVTIENTDGAARHVHATAAFEAVEISTQ